ncbi:MAG: ABC transporter permease [Alphaproteobacteria bacterium]|nr:ABC transporter permease [Alphaproteobacteria bacterium]
MLFYVAQRLALAVLIVAVALAIMFGMIHIVPGDPVSIVLGPRATPELIAEFRQRMGMDKPLPVQFLLFFLNVLKGDLGRDVFSGYLVLDLVLQQLPHSAALAGLGLGWAVALGIPLGCFSAIKRNSWLDRVTGVLSVSAIAIPTFVVALYALLVFAVWLRWFPAIGAGHSGQIGEQLWYLVLPAFSIGLGWVGFLARLVRASMLETLSENHVRTARAFGLPERWITYRYALRIAILPTVTLLGIGFGRVISAAVFIEIVFARPGMGKLVYDSVVTQNYPVVLGAMFVATGIFVLFTLAADLVNAMLDPRVREKL